MQTGCQRNVVGDSPSRHNSVRGVSDRHCYDQHRAGVFGVAELGAKQPVSSAAHMKSRAELLPS